MGLTSEVADHGAAFAYDRVNIDALGDFQVVTFVEKVFADDTSYLIFGTGDDFRYAIRIPVDVERQFQMAVERGLSNLARYGHEGPRCIGTCTGLFGLGLRMLDGQISEGSLVDVNWRRTA